MSAVTVDEIKEALRDVYDPEIPVNVLDLGLIYDIQVNEDQVYVKMTLTAPGCGMGPYRATSLAISWLSGVPPLNFMAQFIFLLLM